MSLLGSLMMVDATRIELLLLIPEGISFSLAMCLGLEYL